MLSTFDIRPYVEAVLLATHNNLSAYQILEQLPVNIREQLIAERGWPGAGNGNRFTAASLVRQAVEGLLPSVESPYRIYIDSAGLTFHIAGQKITAGNRAIAMYRLRPDVPQVPDEVD